MCFLCVRTKRWPTAGVLTIPAAVLITYALLGIEDIGVQIEEPFDVLPLRQYSGAIQASVNTILKAPIPIPIPIPVPVPAAGRDPDPDEE